MYIYHRIITATQCSNIVIDISLLIYSSTDLYYDIYQWCTMGYIWPMLGCHVAHDVQEKNDKI